MVQILLGRSGTQEDAELTPQTLVVKVGGGGALSPEARSSRARCCIPSKASTMGSRLTVWVGRTGTRICSSPPSVVTMKCRLPKRTSAPEAHPPTWLAIRSLKRSARCAKAPTWCANCRRLEPPISEFHDCVSSPDGVQEIHEGLYWFVLNVSMSSSSHLCS
jgi:hypothetical protein